MKFSGYSEMLLNKLLHVELYRQIHQRQHEIFADGQGRKEIERLENEADFLAAVPCKLGGTH